MSESGIMVTSKTVDLTNCDREQVQFAGAIQPHGVLLVIEEPEFRILQASRNTGDLLGIPADTLIGANLRSLFSEEQVTGLRGHLLRDKLAGAPVYIARAEFNGRDFDVLGHRQDQVLILELEERREPSSLSLVDIYSGLSAAISKLEATVTLQSFLDLAAQEIRSFTGFDRVMIYKFTEDKSGWVRSEALAEGLEPYAGLHYPSSDIPEPARRLLPLTWVRHQPDIAYTPVPIVPENNSLTGKPLDLSYALLRSVSIMYVDYLKNMGARSSLVMTLLRDGKLWGLIACQHNTAPKYVPYEVRTACQFLAQMLSLLISAKEDTEHYQYRMKLKATQLLMVANISPRPDFISGLLQDSPNLLEFVKADGVATIVNGKIASLGQTPLETEIEQIAQWLSTGTPEHVFATDCLSAYLPQATSFKDRCAGLLALRFLDTKNDFILWFRPEIIYTVNWAGDPHKPVDLSRDGRLLPRTSFALWKETVQLKSSPWAEVELQEVKELRAALLELLLRRAEERSHAELEIRKLNEELEERIAKRTEQLTSANRELEAFSYSVSHDLRAPLRHIAGFSRILADDFGPAMPVEARRYLQFIEDAVRRMGLLVEGLLSLAKLGQQSLKLCRTELNAIVVDVISMLQPECQGRDVEWRIAQLPALDCDPILMAQVFQNLLGNALKYSRGRAKAVIEVDSIQRPGKPPIVFVRDNGAGFNMKYAERLFGVFQRFHNDSEFEGTGVGLATVDRIIRRHGGTIWAESEPDLGATFYFALQMTEQIGTRPKATAAS